MLRQIRKLVGVTLCNTWGINVARYSKDKKKIRNVWLMGFTFLLLACMGVFYITMLAYGLCKVGAADIIPAYIVMITSLVILVFSILKAGSILFQMKTYDLLISMPMKPSTIVTSRFISMYVGNLVLSMFTVIPSSIVYGIYQKPNIGFCVMIVIGTFLLPLIPMTIATAIGAIVIAISSRMKHKNLVTILLSLLLTMAALILPMSMSTTETELNLEMLADISAMLEKQIFSMYPPAKLFSQGVIEQNIVSFLGFVAVSIGVFLLLIVLVQWKFVAICSAINANVAKRNFVMKEMKAGSALMALYKKELRRYFSSAIYVLNTMVGHVMLVGACIAIAVMGVKEFESTLQMSGVVNQAMPLVMAAMCSLMSTTTSAISLEGKQWWIPKSMPVSTKTVLDSKILVNLTIATPFLFVSEIIMFFTIKTSVLGYIMMVLVPVVYVVFVSVVGIAINLRMPVFNWETEAVVVKQGAATFIAMLLYFIILLVPSGIMVFLSNIDSNYIMGITVIALSGVTGFIYQSNNKKILNQI
ncbi:putative ABC transporter permease subunit [Anaerosporobacter sp.]|uniref:putative ABC transporter permease subunit n=1 Tax=Anaerosporobacter sp. TaxID=1872529 RepID=UPI00286ED3A8|nr:hypothetical protein [Anaerosporobacter sp.]